MTCKILLRLCSIYSIFRISRCRLTLIRYRATSRIIRIGRSLILHNLIWILSLKSWICSLNILIGQLMISRICTSGIKRVILTVIIIVTGHKVMVIWKRTTIIYIWRRNIFNNILVFLILKWVSSTTLFLNILSQRQVFITV